jgi:HlyD family secretion protein
MDKKIDKKKWPPKKIASVGSGVILALFVLYNLIFSDNVSKLNVDSQRITISTVTYGAFQEYIPETGTIIPIKTVYLDAMEGGRIEERFTEAGNMVREGDPILKLGNTDLLLDIMFREAELFSAANNLRNTRLAMEQNRLQLQGNLMELDYQLKKLKRQNEKNIQYLKLKLISQQEYDDQNDEFEYQQKRKTLAIESFKQDSIFRNIQIIQLEASLDRMQNNLKIAKQKLDNLTLKAPITGQLTSLNAEIGESKASGERLGQIDVLEGFKVRAAIDEHYLPRINLAQHGQFEFANNNYELQIIKIFPEITNGRFDVDLAFIGKEPKGIRRGQTLHIKLELGDLSEANLLARGGFYQKTGGQWVFVVDPSGTFATKRPIRLGRQNPQMFEILEGLESGEKVITSSYDNFGDNEKLVLE